METQTSAQVSSNQPSTQPQNTPSTPAGGPAGATAKSVTQAIDPKPTQQSQEHFEVKVNGKVVKMTRQEVLDHASMSHAATAKFDEAARLRREWEEKHKTYSKNPLQAFIDYANKLPPEERRKAIEDYYTKEYIEPETLTEDQKKLRDAESQLKKYQDEEAKKVKKEQDDKEADLTNKQREYLQNQIIEALDRSGLPKTKLIASRMAFYMRENLVKGWDAPIDLIVKQVRDERQTLMHGELGGLEGESLVQYLGQDVCLKLRKYDLEQLRSKRASKTQEFTKPQGSGADGYGNPDKISSSDVTRRLKELRSGKKSF
jgi:hypothetical protein